MMNKDIKNQLELLHDAEIFGIKIDRFKETLEIQIQCVEENESSEIKLVLQGVDSFFCDDFAEQNVILDVILFKKVEDSTYFKFCKSKLRLQDSFFEDKSKAVLYIEPSTGAELACTFSDLELTRLR